MSDAWRGPIVFFDGHCGLCQGFVQFMIRRDRAGVFHYAPLQGATAAALLSATASHASESVILLDGSRVHDRSEAVLRIATRLGAGWPLLGALRVIPRPIRDRAYDWVARNRYIWFGRATVCGLLGPEVQGRFLP